MFKLKKLAEIKISETLNKYFSTKINYNLYQGIRPQTEEELNYYLAGLIEGDGHIGKDRINICFHEDDIELIEYLQNKLNLGKIKKIKNKKAYTLDFNKKEEIKKIIDIINGKLKTEYKYLQLKNLILNLKLDLPIKSLDNTSLFSNNWLAGFIDADGSLQLKIKTRKRKTKTSNVIVLNLQITQKEKVILDLIKNTIGGGHIGTRTHPNKSTTYYYGSYTFKNIINVVEYLSKYHLQSYKYIRYLKFKEILDMYNKKEHLTEIGLKKIHLLKKEYFETYKRKEKVEK